MCYPGAHGHFSLIRQFTIVSCSWEKEWSAFPPSHMWSRVQPPSKWGVKVGEGKCRANTILNRKNRVWSVFRSNDFTSTPQMRSSCQLTPKCRANMISHHDLMQRVTLTSEFQAKVLKWPCQTAELRTCVVFTYHVNADSFTSGLSNAHTALCLFMLS